MSEVIDAKMYVSKDGSELIFAHQWDGDLKSAGVFLGYSNRCPDKLLVDDDSTLFGFRCRSDDSRELIFCPMFCCKINDYLILEHRDNLENNIIIADKRSFEKDYIGEPLEEENINDFYKKMATWLAKKSIIGDGKGIKLRKYFY